jgi:serine protease
MHASRPSGIARTATIAVILVAASACRDSFGPSGQRFVTPSPAKLVAPRMSNAVADSRPIQDEYIVVFDRTVEDVHGRAAALASVTGASIRFEYTSAIRGYAAHMSAQAAAAIAQHPGVAYVEQDQEFTGSITQTGATWGIDRIDQASLPLSGSYSFGADGSGVNAYVIDGGIRHTHTQFGGRVVPAFSSINDGYGPDGCNYHGTHVAGTIGGITYGVAKGVMLHSVRVLDCNGSGSTSGVIAGIDWITANRVLPAVANMSLSGSYSESLNAAVQNSINSGVTYVVSAGNSATDACGYSPASTAAALTVGATNPQDMQSSFSNYGGCVDIYAPGSGILSALNSDDYAVGTLSGTSMAAPHVAGAAALYLQLNPNATPAQVAQAIISNATTGAMTTIGAGSPNRILRVNGSTDGGEVTLPPSTPPTTGNAAPVASFLVKCQSNKNNCVFDASSSSDDSGITSMSWSFGDGSSATGTDMTTTLHTYSSKGTYTVTLTVSDAAGLRGTASSLVAVKSLSR